MRFDWNTDNVARLKVMWRSAVAIDTIAATLHTTYDAVQKKARRLKLGRHPAANVAGAITVHHDEPQHGRSKCQWPIGHPGNKDFHFCGTRAVPGKPYCQEHVDIAYSGAKKKVAAM